MKNGGYLPECSRSRLQRTKCLHELWQYMIEANQLPRQIAWLISDFYDATEINLEVPSSIDRDLQDMAQK
jgi:hypothetical protein